MDSRDSTQSTAAGNTSGEDDSGVLSVTASLAKEAALYFQSRKFDECLDLLKQLLDKKPDDPKILHNIAIAEYFRDGCTDPKKLLEALNNVKNKSEELARATGEQTEGGGNIGNKAGLGSKGSGVVGNQVSAANSGSLVYMDEFDVSVAKLNIAVIWFHLHEYAKALSVLEPLYQNIEPIDETTALQICLLLLDVALACHDAFRSADVLIYLEKAFGVGCVNQVDSGSMGQQSTNLLAKYSSVPSNSSTTDASNSDLAATVNASENALSRTLSEETLEDDTVLALSSLEISGQNLTRPVGLSSNELSRTLVDRSISTVDLKLKLQLYKVRFLLLTRNLKHAKREVKLAMNIARGKDSSLALFLKSQLEYARRNHRKAIKLLLALSNRTEMGISSMFNNNLGCIYYQLAKYHTSSVFLSKALSNSASLRKDKPLKLLTFSQDKSLLITYNCGLQYLACGKPVLAARCFQKSSLVFYKQPLLWLRLAECCLMALEKGLVAPGRSLSDGSEVKVHVIGKGKWRYLVMEDGFRKNGHVDSPEKNDSSLGSDGQPKLSMPLARQCLLNALHLLSYPDLNYSKFGLPSNSSVEESESSEGASSKNLNHKSLSSLDSKISVGLGQVTANGDAKDQKGGTSLEVIQNSLSYYEDVCRRENQMIKQALLANLTYVELEMENPVKALAAARSLLELPDCSRIYIFLGHIYAAEALCLLNRPKEAAEHFSMYLSGGDHFDLPFSREDCEQWQVEKIIDCEELNGGPAAAKNPSPEDSQDTMFPKPEEARGTLYVNIAAMFAMQGEFERAHHFVTQALSILPRSTEATLTAIYVDLMLGKSQEALAKLKHCNHVRFLPSGLQLSKSC